VILDIVVEGLFYLDFIFCFCQEYYDVDEHKVIDNLTKIAKHYVFKGSCIFDLLACIPFSYINRHDSNQGRIYKLFKLLRVPRLFDFLDTDNVKNIIKGYYHNQLTNAVIKHDEEYKYSIITSVI